MRYISTYLLSVLGGNQEPESEDIVNILSSVGIETDVNKAKEVVQAIDCRDVKELIAEGLSKISSVPTGGASAAGPASSAPAAAEVKEEVKEAAKESSSESDADMGFGLFD